MTEEYYCLLYTLQAKSASYVISVIFKSYKVSVYTKQI